MTKLESILMAEEKTAPTATAVLEKPAPVIPGGLPAGREVSTTPQTLSLVPESVARRIKLASNIFRCLFGGGDQQQPGQQPEDDYSDVLPPLDTSGNGGNIISRRKRDRGGGGGGRGPHDRDPHRTNPDDEDIWSSAFEARGRWITRGLVQLRGLSYEDLYGIEENRRLHEELIRELVDWLDKNDRKSTEQRPFKKPEKQPEPLPKKEPELFKPENLDGLPPARGLSTEYKRLLENPSHTPDQVREKEEVLSIYFQEARKAGLFEGIDILLNDAYVLVMSNVEMFEGQFAGRRQENRMDPGKIIDEIEKIRERGAMVAKGCYDDDLRLRDGQGRNLDQIWDSYIDLAIARLCKLIKREGGVGLLQSDNILGEYDFRLDKNYFGTEDLTTIISSLPTDDELRVRSRDLGELRRLAMEISNDDVYGHLAFEALKASPDEAFRLLVQERARVHKRNQEDRREASRVENLETQREGFIKLRQDQEVYWRPTYSNYYEVSARTPEQFETALETFIQWIRSGSKSPNELFQRVNGFKDALTTAGVRERNHLPSGFVEDLRFELEGLVGVIGANFSNEDYNAQNYKEFMMSMAIENAPDRWIRLGRASKGKVGALLWKLDNDPRLELLFSPQGARGELFDEHEAVQLRDHIMNLLIIETLGLEIKGYDLNDSRKRLTSTARDKNLDGIAKFMSDEDFKNLYDGFTQEDQRNMYVQLKARHDLNAQMIARAQVISRQLSEGMLPSKVGAEGMEIYEAYEAGELKLELDHPAEEALFQRLDKADRIRRHFEAGGSMDDLKGEDAVMYQEARNAVTLALEMYGAMGEKARRSGGIFQVDRVDEQGNQFIDYIPIQMAEKFVQFAVNWTKAEYGHLPAKQLREKVEKAKKRAIEAIRTDGFEAKLYDDNRSEILLKRPVRLDEIYDSNGDRVNIIFDENGKPTNLDFDSRGVAILFDKNGKRLLFNKNIPVETGVDSKGRRIIAVNSFVDFQTATNHLYSRSTTHVYWGHQGEDRGLILRPQVFEAAELFKDGLTDLEDGSQYSAHATQLLITDPTLNRTMPAERADIRRDVAGEIETLLAATEESYLDGFDISDDLHDAFAQGKNGRRSCTIYGITDVGSTKFWGAIRALAATEPDKYAARYERTQDLLLRYGSMARMWGGKGALDVIRMMNYKTYRMVGNMAYRKYVDQSEAADALADGFLGTRNPQAKEVVYGYTKKPTNDSDLALQEFYPYIYGKTKMLGSYIEERELNDYTKEEVMGSVDYPDKSGELALLGAMVKVHGRLGVVLHRQGYLESVTRGDHAPLDLRKKDIFVVDQTGARVYNKAEIERERNNEGSGRHTERKQFDRHVNWINFGAGFWAYRTEAGIFQIMRLPTQSSYIIRQRDLEVIKSRPDWKIQNLQSRWAWLFGKLY